MAESGVTHIARCIAGNRGLSIAYKIIQQLECLDKDRICVKVQWIPSHIGLSGNEEVDRLAKTAATDGSDIFIVPEYSELLPKFKKSQPHRSPWFVGDVSRKLVVIAHRLRSGHIPLRVFAHMMGKVTSPNCKVCDKPEDVYHVLMECVRNQAERRRVFEDLGVCVYSVGFLQHILSCPTSKEAQMIYELATPCLQPWRQWLVRTNDVGQLWAAQPSYLLSQATYILAGLVTLVHAFRKGGRWPYFWVGTVLHGLYADNFWHFVLPEYDNFWHSQTPLMLLGARLPVHIILLYPVFMYNAAYAISKLNLPRYAESFAVGLLVVLIDIPYDITAVKFVHWTWHDTDPNIFDRHYWVPWNSYYFHATFTASFCYIFHASRSWFAPKVNQWESAGKSAELKSLIIASLLGMPGGVLLFVPIYHPLHDHLKIHSEVTFFMLFAIYAAFIIHGLLSDREKNKTRLTFIDYVLILQLIVHYVLYWVLVVFFNPENEVSVGLHEPVGPCNEVATLTTPFGQTLYKRKYLCLEKYDERYFDFHCVKSLPQAGANWYTICGTPFENRAEYIAIMSTIFVLASSVFYSLYFKTVQLPAPTTSKKIKTR